MHTNSLTTEPVSKLFFRYLIPAIMARGLTLEDARDYCIIGCVEPQKGGKTDGWHDAAFFNMCRPMELAFTNGYDKGKKIGPDTGDIADIASMKWEKEPARTAIISPDHSHHGLLLMDGNSVEVCPIDVCFPVLHGKNGEDGTIQGLFELANIPYVGCDLLSSANCMDKVFTHIILENAGIPMAKWDFVTMRDMDRFEEVAERMDKQILMNHLSEGGEDDRINFRIINDYICFLS